MVTSAEHQIHDAIQFLKTEIMELETRLRDRQRPLRSPQSVSKRVLASAQRVDELISRAYP